MRVALKQNSRRQRVSITRSIPAPVGGWNARDAISDMDPNEAITMVNFFPSTSKAELRKGYAQHVTGITGPIDSLMTWADGSSEKMFGAANNAIYEVTTSGAVGAAVVSSLTNNRWQHVNFGTAGGEFLVMCNGDDAVQNYDGTTWTTPTLTGGPGTPAGSSFIHLNVFKERIFFIEKDSLSFWYLPVNAISGTVTEFPLHSITHFGGHLVAMATWTRDGGSGSDDVAVFLTSEGEAIVYAGTDPGTASTWALIGVFRIAPPVGRRCFVKVGADVAVITQGGFLPLSRALPSGRADPRISISDKISGAVNDAVRSASSNFGWQAILYPKGNMGIFNIPIIENSTIEQYVVNLTTTAWCKFTGMDANCWTLMGDDLYFGGNTVVYKADTGEDDDGSNIEGQIKPAFNYFGQPGALKYFNAVRPVIETSGDVVPTIDINVDFEDRNPTSTPSTTGSGGSAWDVSAWDVTAWGDTASIQKNWQGVGGVGYSGTINMKVATSAPTIALHSVDYMYEVGSAF